jgi:hypothetical protein
LDRFASAENFQTDGRPNLGFGNTVAQVLPVTDRVMVEGRDHIPPREAAPFGGRSSKGSYYKCSGDIG